MLRAFCSQRVAGVPGAIASFAGVGTTASSFVDPAVPIMGMDPYLIVGLGALATSGVGYMAGCGDLSFGSGQSDTELAV